MFYERILLVRNFQHKGYFYNVEYRRENIAYKRPSEIPCLWNTITQLSKIEQNCENLHLKDNHFARNMLVEQSHQNTCRECTRESVRRTKCFFCFSEKLLPLICCRPPRVLRLHISAFLPPKRVFEK